MTLTATPNAGSQFTRWSGDCAGKTEQLAVWMDTDKNCISHFSKIAVVDDVDDPVPPSNPPSNHCSNPFLPCEEQPNTTTGCMASYQNNSLMIPCLNIASLFSIETYQVELKQQPFIATFVVDLDSVATRAAANNDACAAEYASLSGELHVPCVEIKGTSDVYNVYLLQQPQGLLFDLDVNRILKAE